MKTLQHLATTLILLATFVSIAPLDLLAQRSRGGGSFGGRRSYSAPRSAPRSPSGGGSFGGRRQYSSPRSSPSSPAPRSQSSPTRYGNAPTTRNSMGGTRMATPSDYTSRYGTPRRTETRSVPTSGGGSSRYVVNQYGGLGDGFMMGYVMGSMPWYWSMPFHPAFYYSRPYTVTGADGTTGVYPGTFQWGTLFVTLLIVGGVAFIIYVWAKNRRRVRFAGMQSPGSDTESDPGATSSFM